MSAIVLLNANFPISHLLGPSLRVSMVRKSKRKSSPYYYVLV